ncbi:secondary thiamine-phosphate synthase enzyme YjbQ [Halocatena marina]|uniref:Secondary thiamine-phosphate synthase enzyme YjbQ n=1 Tax=Halocatena marina TaxID=2934937 RepID=A0ABD5YP84_9EURY|nr:secondary thiamine-phosphate synthase enzyme YjbQ [Halocatena marina]
MQFQLSTNERVEYIDVTDRVTASLDIDSGLCTVFVPHTTAGVVVNEDEQRLRSDVERVLNELVPQGAGYAHDDIDRNADAHLRAMLLGEHVTVPVENSALVLGTWQSIVFVECDGPRDRRVSVTTIEK